MSNAIGHSSRRSESTKTLRWLLALVVATAAYPSATARAAPIDCNRIFSLVERSLKRTLDPMYANFGDEQLTLKLASGSDAKLRLGKTLGSGMQARVYLLEGIEAAGVPGIDGPHVVKMAHLPAWRRNASGAVRETPALAEEAAEWSAASRQAEHVWGDAALAGRDLPWNRTALPVAPIVTKLETNYGTILIKPLVRGESVAALAARYGARIDDLPREIRDGIGDIYLLAQALHRNVTLEKAGRRFPLRPDLKPDNLFWVSDPSELSRFGLRKPGFVLVELSGTAGRQWPYRQEAMGLEGYLGIFGDYLAHYSAKRAGKAAPAVVTGGRHADWQDTYAPVFDAGMGAEFRQGEQVLQGTTPLLSHPGYITGRIVPRFGMLTNIPEEYQPAFGRVFPVEVRSRPASDFTVHSSRHADPDEIAAVIHPKGADGLPDRSRILYYSHPLDHDFVTEHLGEVTSEWPAMTTSSGRTLSVYNPESGAVDMIKTSLHSEAGALGGFIPKVNGAVRVEKAVALSDAVHDFHRSTGGELPLSGKRWSVMEEYYSVIPKDGKLGGYIGREYRSEVNPDEILLTHYALFSKRAGKSDTWFEEFFRRSGYRSREEFAWHEFAAPATELHNRLTFENDFATQLHQQNMLFAVERDTGRVRRVVMRDVEGMGVGYTLRTHALNQPPVLLRRDFVANARDLEFWRSPENQSISYFRKLRTESILWPFGASIGYPSAFRLARRADRMVVEAFNRAYPDHRIRSVAGLGKALREAMEANLSPEEREAYAPHRAESSKDVQYVKKLAKRVLSREKSGNFTADDQQH